VLRIRQLTGTQIPLPHFQFQIQKPTKSEDSPIEVTINEILTTEPIQQNIPKEAKTISTRRYTKSKPTIHETVTPPPIKTEKRRAPTMEQPDHYWMFFQKTPGRKEESSNVLVSPATNK